MRHENETLLNYYFDRVTSTSRSGREQTIKKYMKNTPAQILNSFVCFLFHSFSHTRSESSIGRKSRRKTGFFRKSNNSANEITF